MSLVEPLVGIGRVFAQGRFVALVEYVLVLTIVGHFRDIAGAITVLEGSDELDHAKGLKLQLNDGKTTPISVSSNGAQGRYDVTATHAT